MGGAGGWSGLRVLTIGHSTRTLDELVALLRGSGVSLLADIRTIPRSRRNPWFDRDALRAALPERGLRYAHLPELGGLRRARPDSINTGWRNASFRGFADYMQTPGFEAGLEALRALAARGRVAIMCAEAVPWRCHRSLVADALVARGARVEHVSGPSRASPHELTPFAKVEGTRVSYPGEGPAARPAPRRGARRPAGKPQRDRSHEPARRRVQKEMSGRPGSGLPPFERVVALHGPALLRFCAAQAGAQRADDCFQETMLAALRAYAGVRDPAAIRAWLFSIALRKAIDLHRGQARAPAAASDPEALAAAREPAQRDAALWARVRSLPEKQRHAVALRYLADLSHKEIAAIMETSEAAARRNVFEGLARLRRELAP
jgi:RNA polymerase sigma factor (sigma-70 family)